jgi:alkanesulfonate monooxygenase
MSSNPLQIYWFLIHNDGHFPWSPEGERLVDYDYLNQLVRAVDHLGYTGALLATNAASHDVWVMASSLMPATKKMKFILAVHPGIIAPTMLAQMAATFDQFSDGRLVLNIITGEAGQFPPYGIYLDHAKRYQYTDEYWTVWKRIISGEVVDFEGEFVSLKGGEINFEPVQKPCPELHMSGSSDEALAIAAKHADTYLTWGEPPQKAGEKIARVRKLAAEQGRTLRCGVRLHLIVRETKKAAWEQAQWYLDHIDRASVEARRTWTAASDSVGQKRMDALIGDKIPKDARDMEIYPDLWAGFGLIRRGPGTAVVGDPETVAARLQEYRDVGFDTFVFSAHPLLEEAYNVAETVFPLLDFPAERKKKSKGVGLVPFLPKTASAG